MSFPGSKLSDKGHSQDHRDTTRVAQALRATFTRRNTDPIPKTAPKPPTVCPIHFHSGIMQDGITVLYSSFSYLHFYRFAIGQGIHSTKINHRDIIDSPDTVWQIQSGCPIRVDEDATSHLVAGIFYLKLELPAFVRGQYPSELIPRNGFPIDHQ